jgi:prepilin-type processing-associated H-X9-DG protein
LLVVVGIIGLLASILMPSLARAREAARRAVCGSNLRQVGMCLQMYADESNGRYPPLQPTTTPGCLMPRMYSPLVFKGSLIFPEYLADARVLVCPSDLDGNEQYEAGRWREGFAPLGHRHTNPCLFDDLSYHYVPWAIRTNLIWDDAMMDYDRNFVNAFQEILRRSSAGLGVLPDWSFVDENRRKQDVLALHQGVGRFMITDINAPWKGFKSESEMPVFFDQLSVVVADFNHVPGGSNVLYLDGHVSYEKFGSIDHYLTTRAWAMAVPLLRDPIY